MRLGIDLGTTRTVVAAFDRGNYPVVGFTTGDGDLLDHYPSVTAEKDGKLVHGIEAEAAERDGAPSLRSWKRLLATVHKDEPIRIGSAEVTPIELVSGFLLSLKRDITERSNLSSHLDDSFEAVVSVPANAHSTQRFVTMEGFKRAGFSVRAVINEPSAAGIEFAHRHKTALTSRREHVVVYDLGGGTFDAALVHIAEGRHDIETTSGIAALGGDDFDAQLLAMALERAGKAFPVTPAQRADLLRECRTIKEAIHPNTRKITLDLLALGDEAPERPVVIPVADFYERTRPLVMQTLEVLEPLVAQLKEDESSSDIAGIYVVGGGSGLPIVPRTIRERFGRRVHRSPHAAAATAIGCAIAACSDEPAKLGLSERFTRHFGVFREAAQGRRAIFDGIFAKGEPMPTKESGPLVVTRQYRAAHNIGYFRFVEAGHVDSEGDPTGDVTPHREVLFPFVSGLEDSSLAEVPIARFDGSGPLVEERYEVDESGIVAVTITDIDKRKRARYVL